MAVEVFFRLTKGQVLSLSKKCHSSFIKQTWHLSAFPTAVSMPLSLPVAHLVKASCRSLSWAEVHKNLS